MKPPSFDYHAPQSAAEALELLGRYGTDARLLAGGQSLVPLLNFRLSAPAVIVDLNRAADLAYIKEENGQVRMGAMTRQRAIEFSPLVKAACRCWRKRRDGSVICRPARAARLAAVSRTPIRPRNIPRS